MPVATEATAIGSGKVTDWTLASRRGLAEHWPLANGVEAFGMARSLRVPFGVAPSRWPAPGMLLAVAGTLAVLAPQYAAAAQYFCTPAAATGFYYNDSSKEWKDTKYTANMYYTITPLQFGKHAYVVKQLGEPDAVAYCQSDFTGAGLLLCQRRHISLKFSRKTGNYMMVSSGDYVSGGQPAPARPAGPWLQIGTCTPY